MATTRQSIVRGPGTVSYNGVKLFDSSGITAEVDSATADINSSLSGKLDTIKTDQIGKISLTPVGEISNAILAVLYPDWIRNNSVGQSIFGATDTSLVISSRAGKKVTFAAAGITKVPEIYLSPVKTSFGSAEFTALVANGKLPDEAGAFYTVEDAEYADGEPSRLNLTGFHYAGVFGGLTIPDTVDGWTISIELQTEPVPTDSQGTIDYTFTGVIVRASCTPLGLSEADILSKLPTGNARGASLASTSDLVISAEGGLTVTLKKAALVTGPLQWGATTLRAGQIGFVANLDATSGKLFDVSFGEAE